MSFVARAERADVFRNWRSGFEQALAALSTCRQHFDEWLRDDR
jgi:hypothetical protein